MLPAASATASWSTGSPSWLVDAGGAQRERAAERPAQVVSLRQLAAVNRKQRASPRQESDIQSCLIVRHPRIYG